MVGLAIEEVSAGDLMTGGGMEASVGQGVTERGALGIGTKQIDPKKGWRNCVNVLLCRKCF